MDLGVSSPELPGGLHVCYLFGDDEERFRLVARFFEAGARAGDKLFYIADTMTPEQVRQRLQALAFDPTSPGARIVLRSDEAYFPEGQFSPDDMLARIRALFERGVEEGFRGMRATGEMSWMLKGVQGSERAIEFESRVTSVLQAYPHSAVICQYDLHLFSGETFMDALAVHPYIIIRGQFVENPFFIDPVEFLKRPRRARSPGPPSAHA
jgi:hypothetical protein